MVLKFPVRITVGLKQTHHRRLHLLGVSSEWKRRRLQLWEEGRHQLPALGFHPLKPLQKLGIPVANYTQQMLSTWDKAPSYSCTSYLQPGKEIPWHPILQHPPAPSAGMEWWWDHEPSTVRMLSQKSFKHSWLQTYTYTKTPQMQI